MYMEIIEKNTASSNLKKFTDINNQLKLAEY